MERNTGAILEMIDELVCCNVKFNNCPKAIRENGKIVLVGDDGARVPFEPAQFEVLLSEGSRLLGDR